jgi:hypothetical protein
MQVDVLRKGGEVLFIEASSDFVSMLCSLLRDASVGSVAALTGVGAFSQLHESIAGMRQAVFSLPKAGVLSPPLTLCVNSGPVRLPVYKPEGSLCVSGGDTGPWTLTGQRGWGGTMFKSRAPTHGFTMHLQGPFDGNFCCVGIVPAMTQKRVLKTNPLGTGVFVQLDSSGSVYINGSRLCALPSSGVWPPRREVLIKFRAGSAESNPRLELNVDGRGWIDLDALWGSALGQQVIHPSYQV